VSVPFASYIEREEEGHTYLMGKRTSPVLEMGMTSCWDSVLSFTTKRVGMASGENMRFTVCPLGHR